MAKHRDEPRSKRRHYQAPEPTLVDRLRALLLPAAVALLVATPLLLSEAVAAQGTHAALCMLWTLLLAAWSILWWLTPAAECRCTWSDGALAALVVLHTVSGLVPRAEVIPRSTWNVVWVWISYGIAVLLLRQLLRSSVQMRALVVVMFALAVILAAHAYYQYFVSFPRMRMEFERSPHAVLRENQIPLDPYSPERKLFEDRIRSLEPLSTFALTNSLAGFVAPWLVFGAGLALLLWQAGRGRLAIGAAIGGIVLIGCLLLTKSRTAFLAVIAGCIAVAMYGRAGGWKLDWRLPAAAGGALLVIALAVVATGGLDVQVLSEAPKSLLYRLEYWQSTAAMIAENPLFGCGPGNFQDFYLRYKLPQASETPGDPHNVFLEIWATAGTPALVALLAWLGSLAVELGWPRQPAPTAGPAKPVDPQHAGGAREIYVSALVGIGLGFFLAFLAQVEIWTEVSGGHIAIGLIGLPLAGVIIWWLHPWVVEGPAPVWLFVIALFTLLINLLAAGAAYFPGVVVSAWVLVPCAMNAAGVDGAGWQLPKSARLGLVAAALLLAFGCYRTEYLPVLYHQALMQEAEAELDTAVVRRLSLQSAEEKLRAAAAADPASGAPWRMLAEAHLARYMATGSDAYLAVFLEAAQEWARRAPFSPSQWRDRGHLYFQAFRQSGNREHLAAAIDAYSEAAARHPASGPAQAQLAWALNVAGRESEARQAADEALRLDDLYPHAEYKLRNLRLMDPQPDPENAANWQLQRPENAEQTMQRLRTAQGSRSGV